MARMTVESRFQKINELLTSWINVFFSWIVICLYLNLGQMMRMMRWGVLIYIYADDDDVVGSSDIYIVDVSLILCERVKEGNSEFMA